jgi:tetratricopeptide (TPR) repeat protein
MMRDLIRFFCLFAVVLVFCHLVYAEDRVLVVHVADPKGQPIPGVILSTTGDSSTSPATDNGGKSRIKLAAQTAPNSEVKLQIIRSPEKKDLVFVSPWDSRVRVPPFENESQNFVSVVLIEAGDKAWLEYGIVSASLAAQINVSNTQKKIGENLTDEERLANLGAVAKAYGFKEEDVDKAIRALGKTSSDSFQLGQVALYERNYPEAEKQLLVSKEERKKNLDKAQRDYADVNFSLGQTYYEQGKFKDAVDLYQVAANLRPTDSKTLSALAAALEITGDSPKAEDFLKKALAIDEKDFGPSSPEIARRIWELGAFYANHNNFEQCEHYFKRVISVLEKNFGPEYPKLAFHLSNLAMLYMTKGKNFDAESLIKRAVAIQEKAYGSEDPRVAYSLNTLGALYWSQKKTADAEQVITRALNMILKYAQSSTDKTADASELANNFSTGASYLATIYKDQGKYAEAEKYLETRAALEEKSLGSMSPQRVKSLDQLADIYAKQKKYDDAEATYRRSLAIMENALGNASPQLDHAIYNLAVLYEEQNKSAEAEAEFKRVITLYEKAGLKPLELVASIINLAEFFRRQQKYVEAESQYKRCLTMIESSGEPQYPSLPAVLTKLAGVYSEEKKFDDAEKVFVRALGIVDKAQNPQFSDLVFALDNLADFYVSQKRYSQAEPLFRRMLSVLESHEGANNRNVAVATLKLATVCREQGKYTDARPLYERAIQIFDNSNAEPLATAEALEGFAILLRKMNLTPEAQQKEARAKDIRDKQAPSRPKN